MLCSCFWLRIYETLRFPWRTSLEAEHPMDSNPISNNSLRDAQPAQLLPDRWRILWSRAVRYHPVHRGTLVLDFRAVDCSWFRVWHEERTGRAPCQGRSDP